MSDAENSTVKACHIYITRRLKYAHTHKIHFIAVKISLYTKKWLISVNCCGEDLGDATGGSLFELCLVVIPLVMLLVVVMLVLLMVV